MRIISNAEAREMSDTRQIMAAALWAYRDINKSTPLFFTTAYSDLRYRAFCIYSPFELGVYTVEYDTKEDTLYVEAIGKDGQRIKIMIFE